MDYTLGDVLREVNNLRFYEFSLPPLEKLPKGSCRLPSSCVIARCFPCNKYGYEPYTDGDTLFYFTYASKSIPFPDTIRLFITEYESNSIPLPDTIRLFITDFDNGEWPSLIDKNVSSIDSTIDVDSQTPILVTS